MRRLLPLAALIVLVAPVRTRAQSAAPDTAGARRAVEAYFRGHATGDGAHFRQAFHPVAHLYWVRADTLATRTSAEYAAGASGRPAPDEAARRRRIVFLDVVGTSGVAKVELDYPTVTFVDYLSLLKLDGAWRIVAKTFNVAPKTGS